MTDQPAVVRQILDHLGLAVPATCFRAPPQGRGVLAVRETLEWTYKPLG